MSRIVVLLYPGRSLMSCAVLYRTIPSCPIKRRVFIIQRESISLPRDFALFHFCILIIQQLNINKRMRADMTMVGEGDMFCSHLQYTFDIGWRIPGAPSSLDIVRMCWEQQAAVQCRRRTFRTTARRGKKEDSIQRFLTLPQSLIHGYIQRWERKKQQLHQVDWS